MWLTYAVTRVGEAINDIPLACRSSNGTKTLPYLLSAESSHIQPGRHSQKPALPPADIANLRYE